MADVSLNFAIRVFQPVPLAAGGTPIVAPISCSRIVLQNTDGTNAFILTSDASTPGLITQTSKTLAANGTETLQSTNIAWGPGAVVCVVSAAIDAAPLVATFTR